MTVEPERIASELPLMEGPDPVVRMPKRMAPLPPEEPPGVGTRLVLAVAAMGALLGAGLGAVGLGIVHATRSLPATASAAALRAPVAPEVAAPPAVYALAVVAPVDAGAVAPPGPRFEAVQQSLGAGRPLAAALRAVGVPRAEVGRAIAALDPFLDMRSLRPGDRVAAMREPDTRTLRRVEFRRAATQVWAAVRDDAGQWRGERVEVVMRTETVRTGFRVEGSVEASLRAAGLNPEVVPRIAEAFQAMDLPPRLLAHDVLRLVVEEERMNGQFFRYGRVLALDYRGALGQRRGYLVTYSTGAGEWFDAQGMSWERGPLRSPVPSARISSRFNPRRMHPVLHVLKPHNGVDWAAPIGTPIYAPADGQVLSVGPAGPSGNLIRVRHAQLGVETGYCHLSRFAAGLRPGQRVRARQVLGYVGTTGRSTGPHLHFSVRRDGVFIDPLSLHGGRHPVPAAARARFEQEAQQRGGELDQIAVNGETLAPPDAIAPPPSGMLPPVAADSGAPSPPEEEGPDESMDESDEAD
ncbi:MAG: M23 family metallopeptidase [Myxococcaceae bacterium]|nr:MAG: M23 family metallopeptidase [Myxococcaceae bacterium]